MPTFVEKLSTSDRSPLSPTHWPADAFSWRRSLLVLLAWVVAFVAGLVFDSLIAVHMGVTQADVTAQRLSWGILAGQLASYVPPLVALFALLPWLSQRTFAELGLRLPDRRAVGAGVIGALAMYAVTIGIANLQFAVTHQKPEEAASALFASAHDPTLSLAFGFLAVVVAPFVEELTFRGFLFNTVLRYTPVWFAAVLSGIVFGLFHGSLTAFVPLACSGIVLAYVYYISGSLTASMLTHGLFNAINVALLALGKTT
jgi:membrane protease YdiL (CAAX protease family)